MKKTNPLTRILAGILTVMLIGIVPAAATDTVWKLVESTQIICTMEKTEELCSQVEMFAAELKEKLVMETYLPIVYDDSSAGKAGDIILVLDSGNTIPAQGYSIKVENEILKIEASDADGLFYGCRAVIKQLILNDGNVTAEEDSPSVIERAVSLDNGRKYFSVEWIKKFIREMSWANMNTLVLHFSEEMGLGIESKLYPWLNGRDGALCTQAEISESETDHSYLTQEETIDIIKYAKQYHIDIVPSLDSPGHMNYIVKKFNENCADKSFTFTYNGKTYTAPKGTDIGNFFQYGGTRTEVVPGSRNGEYSRGIDISNEIAVAFTKSLIEEYAVMFAQAGCTKFDIGGDELLGWGTAAVSTSIAPRWQQLDHWKAYAITKTGNEKAVAYDAFLLYMNELNALVRKLGYTSVRMWNDDALRKSDTGWTGVVQLDKDIDIWFWTTGENIFYDYAIADYQLYNIISDYNYYAMTSDYFSDNRGSFVKAYPKQIYNEWTPFIFYPDNLNTDGIHNPDVTTPNTNVLGGAFGVWCDNPSMKTEAEVMTDLLPLIRANAAKSWDVEANDKIDYDTYVSNWTKLGNAPAETEYVSGAQLDTTGLQAAILLANEFIAKKETGAYVNPVGDIQNLVNAVTAAEELVPGNQEEIDTAEAAIMDAYNAVFTYDVKENADGTVDTTNYILSGSFVSSRVYVGKVATLNITVQKGLKIKGFDITYVADGEIKHVPYFRFLQTNNRTKTIYRALFNPTEEHVDSARKYTIRVIFEDGTVSNDYIEKTIDVRG